MKLSNSEIDVNRLLMASMLDQLNFLAWAKTKNAQRGTNKPKSVVASLLDTKKDFVAFDSVEEFERARDMILNRKE